MEIRKLADNVIAGIVITVAGGWILHLVLKETPTKTKPEREVHFQEIKERKFQSRLEIRTDNEGNKYPVDVFGHMDLDDGDEKKSNADITIRIPYFRNDHRPRIRSLYSDIYKAQNDCGHVKKNPRGSSEIYLAIGQKYCIRTNKDRIASIVVNDVDASWAKYAFVNVTSTIMSYNN